MSIKSSLESILKYHPDLAKIKEAEELPNEEVLDNLSKFITRQKSKLDTKIDVRELISKKLEGIAKEVQYLAQIFQDQNLSGQKKAIFLNIVLQL